MAERKVHLKEVARIFGYTSSIFLQHHLRLFSLIYAKMNETSDPDQQYNKGPPRRALIAVTSAHAPLYPDGKETGLFVTEALHPFNVFRKVSAVVPAIEPNTDGLGWVRGRLCLSKYQEYHLPNCHYSLHCFHTSMSLSPSMI